MFREAPHIDLHKFRFNLNKWFIFIFAIHTMSPYGIFLIHIIIL